MLWSDFGRLWDPWREFDRMSRALTRWSSPASIEFPAMNVWVSPDNAVVTTELPGIDPKEIDISVVGKSLTVRGSRQPVDLKDNESFHRRERWSGQFTKTIELPFSIDTGKVDAKFIKGVLHINLPRAEADKPRKISVKSD
jgi:HSP20 family protein